MPVSPLTLHALQGFLLRLFNVRRDGGGHGFFRRVLQLGLQSGEQRARFRSHGVGGAFAGRALNLLLGLGDQARHLPCELQRTHPRRPAAEAREHCPPRVQALGACAAGASSRGPIFSFGRRLREVPAGREFPGWARNRIRGRETNLPGGKAIPQTFPQTSSSTPI